MTDSAVKTNITVEWNLIETEKRLSYRNTCFDERSCNKRISINSHDTSNFRILFQQTIMHPSHNGLKCPKRRSSIWKSIRLTMQTLNRCSTRFVDRTTKDNRFLCGSVRNYGSHLPICCFKPRSSGRRIFLRQYPSIQQWTTRDSLSRESLLRRSLLLRFRTSLRALEILFFFLGFPSLSQMSHKRFLSHGNVFEQARRNILLPRIPVPSNE